MEKPILFNTEMVRAILEGRKTMTRRIIKPQPAYCTMSMAGLVVSETPIEIENGIIKAAYAEVRKPSFETGDILYVRETWAQANGQYLYRADAVNRGSAAYYLDAHAGEAYNAGARWRPSLHMPREAARIFLRVTEVRAERLQDIPVFEMEKEGLHASWGEGIIGEWRDTWNSTIRPADLPLYGWSANPWVWVVSFEPCDPPTETD